MKLMCVKKTLSIKRHSDILFNYYLLEQHSNDYDVQSYNRNLLSDINDQVSQLKSLYQT